MTASETILWSDIDLLTLEASRLIDGIDVPITADPHAAAMAMRRAVSLVAPVLSAIEQLRQSGLEPNYGHIFAVQTHERIAAVTYLARRALLDLEAGTSEPPDALKRDLASYVEILFRLRAVDALALLFDLAADRADGGAASLWDYVRVRCLYLIALLTDRRERVYAFLDERPQAVELAYRLTETGKPEVRQALTAVLNAYRADRAIEVKRDPIAPEPYAVLLAEFDRAAPDPHIEQRIDQLLMGNSSAELVAMATEGDDYAFHLIIRTAPRALHGERYLDLLDGAIHQPGLAPPRAAALLLELRRLNREARPQGGNARINGILARTALAAVDAQIGVGFLAVDGLRDAAAATDLYAVVEHAPAIAVAERAILALKDIRKLTVIDSILERRPELREAYRAARAELGRLESLVDAALSSPSPEMLDAYLAHLKELNAHQELERIANSRNPASAAARAILNEQPNTCSDPDLAL